MNELSLHRLWYVLKILSNDSTVPKILNDSLVAISLRRLDSLVYKATPSSNKPILIDSLVYLHRRVNYNANNSMNKK
jgi:hypothetical protein